ncbi:MAG: NAD(P)/FAD-dependent oxidoreductase [Pseudomonadota bacterium]
MAKTLSRREFVSATGSAAILAGVAPRRSWAAAKSADVIVIGAGVAGLSSALALEEQGLKVAVVEADNRLGGRCFTMHTQNGRFDCGATTIGPYYGLVRTNAFLADVEFKAPPGRDGFSYHINGGFVHPDAWEASDYNKMIGDERAILPERLEFPIVMKHNKIKQLETWASQDMLRFDIPLDAYLRENGVSEEALRLISLTSNTMDLAETSALFQMREFARLALPQTGSKTREVYAAGKGGDYHYVKGGTSAMIEAWAKMLKTEVRTNAPVKAIRVERDGVDVLLASGEKLRSNSVVCTVPFSTLRNVDISPAPTGKKRLAIETAAYTLTTHVIFLPKKPYWEADGHPAGLIADGLIERVMANYDDDGKVSWLDVWLNGQAAAQIDRYTPEETVKLTQRTLAQLRPSMQDALEPVGVYSWGKNPFIKGNKYVMRPGEAATMYPYLAEPHAGRLFFAGEHTRDSDAGLEAAAQTGVREAKNVLRAFG